jgi:hypothetical protein
LSHINPLAPRLESILPLKTGPLQWAGFGGLGTHGDSAPGLLSPLYFLPLTLGQPFDGGRGVWCNGRMLGRLRKTTRLDVGLALAFSGLAYLLWALVAGVSREMVRDMKHAMETALLREVPPFSSDVKVFFADFGIIIDVAGLAWMVVSLLLVAYAGRQKLSISWAWMSAMLQAFVAAGGGVLVGWAMNVPYKRLVAGGATPEHVTGMVQLSELSLWVVLTVAILIWTTFLVWLELERVRVRSRGPSRKDTLKSNIYP